MSQQQAIHIRDEARFRATAGAAQGFGTPPQEALAALMQLLPGDAGPPIVIRPYNRGDVFWPDARQSRLQDLKARRGGLSAAEEAEPASLVAAASDATVARTRSLPLVES